MRNDRKIAVFIVGFVLAGVLAGIFLPKERVRNSEAVIRIGAGDDMSGILMEETADELGSEYEVSDTLESSSFQDC